MSAEYHLSTADLCLLSITLAGVLRLPPPTTDKLGFHKYDLFISVSTVPPLNKVEHENKAKRTYVTNPAALKSIRWKCGNESLVATPSADGWKLVFTGKKQWGSHLYEALVLTRPDLDLTTGLTAILRLAMFYDNIEYLHGPTRRWQEEQLAEKVQSWAYGNSIEAFEMLVCKNDRIQERLNLLKPRFPENSYHRALQLIWNGVRQAA